MILPSCTIVVLLLHVRPVSSRLDTLKTVSDYMNICLDGRNQKSAPGPEPKLLSQICMPWTARSCCTSETAEGMRTNPKWLNFNWDHCSRPLSDRCREHFIMDLCFYECSPNVGPWLVSDERKIRNERFLQVPLCQSVCENWWDACRDDLTCVDNWATKFNWTAGMNVCPQGNTCRPFHKVYTGASHFCETLMGHSFKVVPNAADCFVLWFDPKLPNPNEVVARKKASALLGIPYETSGGGNSRNNLLVSILLLVLGSTCVHLQVSLSGLCHVIWGRFSS
jgi:folate receptor